MTPKLDRRSFLVSGSGALVGLALGGCRAHAPPRRQAATTRSFPRLEVSGSSYEIGLAIGKRFESFIRKGLSRRKAWFEKIRSFMEADLECRYQPFLAAVEDNFPEQIEELKGWADGSGVPFKDLMALNLKAELGSMMRAHRTGTPGCSTLCYSENHRCLISHNEDGHRAYADLMFVLTASRPGMPTFKSLVYPGILPGNATTMNEAGLVVTTNAIDGNSVAPGLGKYFLCRAVIDATSLEQAQKIVTRPGRAYSHHFNIGGGREREILSIEISPERFQVQPVEGLYLHTNHLILPGMQDTPQNQVYIELSSMPRYRTLSAEIERLSANPAPLVEEDLLRLLSSHRGAPWSPCRHPAGEVSGRTLANSTYDLVQGTWRLTFGNTCRGGWKRIRMKA